MKKVHKNHLLRILRIAWLKWKRRIAGTAIPAHEKMSKDKHTVQGSPKEDTSELPGSYFGTDDVPIKKRRLLIYQSEVEEIARDSRKHDGRETCWQFLGTSSFTGDTCVEYVLGCGPKAIHESTFCKPDQKFIDKQGKWLVKKYGLSHIGAGHSHHRLGLNNPSEYDIKTTMKGMRRNGLESFVQMIVTYDDHSIRLNPFMFHTDTFEHMDLEILYGTSPVRMMEGPSND